MSTSPTPARGRAAAWAVVGVGLCLIGFVLGGRLPRAIYPEVVYPRVTVVASSAGQPAEVLDVAVTRRLEEAVAAVPGVVRVRGRTIRGAAELSVLFDPSADVEVGFQRINSELAGIRGDLPSGTDVVSQRITAASTPVVTFALIGGASAAALRDVALYQLRPRLAGLPGAGLIEVVGGEEREVEVAVDPDRLAAAHLSLADLAARLRAALPLSAAGRLDVSDQTHIVLVRGLVDGPAALEDLAVGGSDRAPIRLREVATVRLGHADPTTLVAAMGRPAVSIQIGRRPGADAVSLSEAVRALLAEAAPSLPTGTRIVMTYDQGDLIAPAVAGVRDAIALGALFAVVVLGLFLRALRPTLIGAMSLPVTLGLTALAMALAGQSWNLMTLGGLAVSIGLVVDDAVVVIEAIERERERGLSSEEAARAALATVRWPVVTSTLATVVVLLPLAGLSGVIGQFFRALAFTLGAAVLLSLASALVGVPLLARRLSGPPSPPGGADLAGRYRRALAASLSRPALALVVAGLVLVAGAAVGLVLPSSFLPEMDEGSYIIDYQAPAGTSLAEADALGQRIDRLLLASPFVRGFSRELGAQLGPPMATLTYQGDVQVRLSAGQRPDFETIAAAQREALARAAPQLHVELSQLIEDNLSDLEGQPDPIEVKVFGNDPARLAALGREVARRIATVPGLVDLYDGDPGCAPRFDADVDPIAAGRAGLSPSDVAAQVEAALGGVIVGEEPYLDRLIGVRLRLSDEARFAPDALEELRVRPAHGPDLPLPALAKITRRCPPALLLSENLRRMVAVTARVQGGNLGAVAAGVRRRVEGLPLPPGYWWELGGEAQTQRLVFGDLFLALALGVFGLFALLALHFASVRLALVVLAGVPVSLACGALSLLAAGSALNISSLLGGLVLAGLIVKNGVLLVDQAERARRAGAGPADALLAAASSRLRPIAMTTAATLLGLLPLALGVGAGASVQQPLAIAVLGGLGLSSLVTLFALPSLYLLAA